MENHSLEILESDRGGSRTSPPQDAAPLTSRGDAGLSQPEVILRGRPAKLPKASRAVATIFCAQSDGWSSKGNLIEHCDGVSDRATTLLRDLLRPGIRVLDLGAGVGKVAENVLGAEPTAKLTLVDHAPGMVRNLRERFKGKHQVRILQADLHTVAEALSDERFELITFFQVLHHLPRPGTALRTAASLLTAGGRVVVLTVGPQHQEDIFPRTSRDGLGRRQASAWVRLTEASGLDIEVVRIDPFSFRFRDGLAYARFLYRIGSLEKLAGYRLLTGEKLEYALHDAALRATQACADAVGRIVVPCEHLTLVARRGQSPLKRR
ncbi:MAG: class I SAM-dependent methyltransferase [Gammaproteobacteria bacterium]